MNKRLKKILPDLSKAKIIEAIISPSVHLEYIEYSSKYVKKAEEAKIIKNSDKLFLSETEIEEKKILLVSMAKIDNIEIFRKIQKYAQSPDEDLKDWSTIAMQESLNLIQSSLLGEESVLISTGLGGKGSKMRFFIIIQNQKGNDFTEIQKKIIIKEINFAFVNNKCEIEKIEFGQYYFTILGLFPFDFDIIEKTLMTIIEELKIFQIILADKYLITNVKAVSIEESGSMLKDVQERIKSNDMQQDFDLRLTDNKNDVNFDLDGNDADDDDDADDDFLDDDDNDIDDDEV